MLDFRQIISHPGFVPVALLLAASIFVSLVGRYSDYLAADMDKNGVATSAVIIAKSRERARNTHNTFGGSRERYMLQYRFALENGDTYISNRPFSREFWDTVKTGDRINFTYNRTNPALQDFGFAGFTEVATRLRIFAWALFLAAIGTGYYFHRRPGH